MLALFEASFQLAKTKIFSKVVTITFTDCANKKNGASYSNSLTILSKFPI